MAYGWDEHVATGRAVAVKQWVGSAELCGGCQAGGGQLEGQI